MYFFIFLFLDTARVSRKRNIIYIIIYKGVLRVFLFTDIEKHENQSNINS